MANDKFITVDASGDQEEILAIATTTGIADANKILQTGADGKIDPTFLPAGEVKTLIAFEGIGAGDMVNVFDDGGVEKVRLADASDPGKRAHGFSLTAILAAASDKIYFEGIDSQLTGLTRGGTYFLDNASPGGITLTPVTTSAHILQKVGIALSATELTFEPSRVIIRA